MTSAMTYRNRIGAFWSGAARSRVRRAGAICAVVVALAVAGFYHARQFASTGDRRAIAHPAGLQAAKATDPLARFNETRVGHVLFQPLHGDMCRRVLFDNNAGSLYEAAPVPCRETEEAPPAADAGTGNRLAGVSRAFRR